MTERQGTFTVPTRLLLTQEQRLKLEQIVRREHVDLADVVSQIVCSYLDELPEPEVISAGAPDRRADIRQRRAELARLRARREAAGASAPGWLNSYISDIEAELRRLEA